VNKKQQFLLIREENESTSMIQKQGTSFQDMSLVLERAGVEKQTTISLKFVGGKKRPGSREPQHVIPQGWIMLVTKY
jgi:hypothetical protein